MEFTIVSPTPESADCLVLPVLGEKLPTLGKELDTTSGGILSQAIKDGELAAKAASVLTLGLPAGLGFKRVVLVQLSKEPNDKVVRDSARSLAKALVASQNQTACVALSAAGYKKQDQKATAQEIVNALMLEVYRFDQFKSDAAPAPKLELVSLLAPKKGDLDDIEAGLVYGLALGHGMNLTRDLGNLPPNVCTPDYLAATAQHLAHTYDFSCHVLEQEELETLKMGSFLSVAKGSIVPPKFIVMEYHNADKKQKPVALVGKGITFDSGGISLKPGEGMDEMKYDMCGAATVLGVFRAVAELDLKINLVGIIPACENMPAGNAVKPGDIVTSMSGQTIEILNTDAEGRLILCDALTYVQRFEPAAVIDIATLTGACIIALGHTTTGLFANDDELADALLAASKDSDDKAWRMPLFDEYQEQLKSNFADMANIGGRPAGSITAAAFLSRFVKEQKWAHLDIAGTAWKSGAAKGATGRPVPLLLQYLSKL
ncbi:leucyl aminopeptidase [Chitinibacter fontanus]|uniref:Probable cytosol aminopeptidase n=1 Tax=Chitinibacter fontanus TaxID=1737446 RepID=A0A7D5V8W4_9NEIS|nr:leucyl aminopeptidase [Chitinibacter fontanus]QLI80996.1 leucyl aminopeptidase [Chitinibacter fontanus]